MIPTAIVLGLVVGRWWAVAVAAIGWALALVATGVVALDEGAVGAASLAAANAMVGVAVHVGVTRAVRWWS